MVDTLYNRDNIVRLINLYKEKECLWNANNPEYYNKILRQDAMEEIHHQLGGIPIEDIKKKINRLRTQYCNEKCKERKMRKNNQGVNIPYSSRWWCYSMLQFLDTAGIHPRMRQVYSATASESSDINIKNESEFSSRIHGEDSLCINGDASYDLDDIKDIVVDCDPTISTPLPSSTPPPSLSHAMTSVPPPSRSPPLSSQISAILPRVSKKRPASALSPDINLSERSLAIENGEVSKADLLQDVFGLVHSLVHREQPPSDEYLAFGVHVAHELRGLRDRCMFHWAKFQIQKVLFEAQCGNRKENMLNTEPSASNIPNSP